MKCDFPVPKAGVSVGGNPQSSNPKPPVLNSSQPGPPEPAAARSKSTDGTRGGDACLSYRSRSHERGRMFKGSKRRSRRSRSRPGADASSPLDGLGGKKVREGRLAAWLAGEDAKRLLRGNCKNCFIGLGTHVPRHLGRSRHARGNNCDLPRRAPGCDGKNESHWVRGCPNRVLLDKRVRRGR